MFLRQTNLLKEEGFLELLAKLVINWYFYLISVLIRSYVINYVLNFVIVTA